MSYKAGIVKAISELKERNGSSSIAIKKHMQVRGQYLLVNTTPLVLFVVVNLIPRCVVVDLICWNIGKHARRQEVVEW